MSEALLISGGVAVGVLLGAALTYFFMRLRTNHEQTIREHLQTASEQLLKVATEKLGAKEEVIKTDLDNKKEAIKTLVEEIRRELTKTDERLRKSDEERLTSFTALLKELDAHKQLTNELRGSTEQLKSLLANNKLRGAFGEQVAENLLKMAGFVIGQDYTVNQAQETRSTRPDFCLILPDKTKINIDVKFPYSALQKMTETDNAEEKKRHAEQFSRDVKEKVKQVTTRDYINPEEGTVDFVILFIPNEMIFSFVYEHLNAVWQEAVEKKVILAGPFSFTAILRLIKQAHSNFSFQKNLHQVIGLIQKFRQEYEKFSEELDVLGSRLDSAAKQFQQVSGTRARQLNRVMDQIEHQSVLEESPQQNLLDQ